MLLDALLSYAHFATVFLTFGTLCAEAFVIRLTPDAGSMRLLRRIDLFYGVSAVLVLVAGFARVFLGAKGAAYYWFEPFFWAKLVAFAIVGLISIIPTMKFFAWNSALQADPHFAPQPSDLKSVRRWILVELHVFALIPLFAAFMARGIGV